VKVAVGHPSEIDEIFDAISYSKGASVIRMLHNYIGDAVSNPRGFCTTSVDSLFSSCVMCNVLAAPSTC